LTRKNRMALTPLETEISLTFDIREDDLARDQTRALLALHLAGMHANSPPGGVFALDLSGLQIPEVTVWTAWRNGRIASVGALKMLQDDTAEVKSMRTHPDFLRSGAASAILERIITVAKSRGVKRLSLETGSGPAFEPALALYRRRGFVNGGPFSDYEQTAFNQFLHLTL
jgi:putative acetyltransferase